MAVSAAATIELLSADVVRRLQQGDDEALGEVYAALSSRVFAIARRILADDGLAQDALQDTFVQIWRSVGSLRSPDAFVGWACKIAANTALQLLRNRSRRPEGNANPTTLPDGSEDRHLAVPSASTDDQIDLEHAIARLSPRRRAVLVLHDVEGYRHREIADLLGISSGTSKATLFRARAKLKEFLER